jgi:hypothetical protein
VLLTEEEDRRSSPLAGDVMRAGLVYKLLMQVTGAPQCDFAGFVWRNRAPPRNQFFVWLLIQERVQCKTNLLRKNIVEDAGCELCTQAEENCGHLFFACPVAAGVWAALGVDTRGCKVSRLWEVPLPAAIPSKHSSVYTLLVCWQIWKQRNDLAFNGAPPSMPRFWAACRGNAKLWCHR